MATLTPPPGGAAQRAWPDQLELLLASTGEGVYGVDLDGRGVFINRAGAERPAHPPGQGLGGLSGAPLRAQAAGGAAGPHARQARTARRRAYPPPVRGARRSGAFQRAAAAAV